MQVNSILFNQSVQVEIDSKDKPAAQNPREWCSEKKGKKKYQPVL